MSIRFWCSEITETNASFSGEDCQGPGVFDRLANSWQILFCCLFPLFIITKIWRKMLLFLPDILHYSVGFCVCWRIKKHVWCSWKSRTAWKLSAATRKNGTSSTFFKNPLVCSSFCSVSFIFPLGVMFIQFFRVSGTNGYHFAWRRDCNNSSRDRIVRILSFSNSWSFVFCWSRRKEIFQKRFEGCGIEEGIFEKHRFSCLICRNTKKVA